MFIAALFMAAKTWRQPKCPLLGDWIKEMWFMWRMEHYPARRKDELLPFVTTWTDLETLTLSEMSQTEKVKNHVISLICGIQN